jgi:dGTPase
MEGELRRTKRRKSKEVGISVGAKLVGARRTEAPLYWGLLTIERARPSTRGSLSLEQVAESDRARVIYCTAFRRLQGKTQVFPLDENAAVRTRLTHSLEVAHIGQYLTTTIVEEVNKRGLQDALGLTGPYLTAFRAFTETACLLHDIGNPPFGHFGESTITNWFEKFDGFSTGKLKTLVRGSAGFLDLTKFDGNSQGFRIATRLAGQDSNSGMNLTLSQLGAMLKYPCTPTELKKLNNFKKAGVFRTEAVFLEKIREVFGLQIGCRFPLAYLMEAADDISYCLSDIEDGIEKRILTHDEAVKGILTECAGNAGAVALVRAAQKSMRRASSIAPVVAFRSTLIRSMVQYAGKQYVDNHDKIIAGELDELIGKDSAHGLVLAAIKRFARQRVYNHKIPRGLELSGAAIMDGLLGQYGKLLSLSRTDMQSVVIGGKVKSNLEVPVRLFESIALRHIDAYKAATKRVENDADEWCDRAHMIVDFISGMTDAFALKTFQRLVGISL